MRPPPFRCSCARPLVPLLGAWFFFCLRCRSLVATVDELRGDFPTPATLTEPIAEMLGYRVVRR